MRRVDAGIDAAAAARLARRRAPHGADVYGRNIPRAHGGAPIVFDGGLIEEGEERRIAGRIEGLVALDKLARIFVGG